MEEVSVKGTEVVGDGMGDMLDDAEGEEVALQVCVGVGDRVAVAVGVRVLLAVMEGVRVGLEVGLGVWAWG